MSGTQMGTIVFSVLFAIVVIVVIVLVVRSRKRKATGTGNPQTYREPQSPPAETPNREPEPVVAKKTGLCRSCGHRNPADNNFCEQCGEKLA